MSQRLPSGAAESAGPGDRAGGSGTGWKLLGLTGGIGMGKSTVSALLERWGWPVCDTDVVARQVVAPGQPALSEIVARFGPEMLDASGALRRDALAARVFADPAARQQLEAILHPRIRAVWRAEAEVWRRAGQPAGVVVVPLLFETGAEREVTATVCVACSPAVQRERLQARGWSAEQIAQRLAAQWPIERKLTAADFVVWNDGDHALLEAQLRRILTVLGLDRAVPDGQPPRPTPASP
jgi:dephospho-CoA kinase